MDDGQTEDTATFIAGRIKRGAVIVSISLVVLVYCGQRMWHLSKIETVSHDAAVYLNMCDKLEANHDEVMSKKPRLARFALVIDRVAGFLGGNRYESRIVAGRSISLGFGLAAVIGMWILAMQFFGNVYVATSGTILFIAGKKFIFLTTDILRGPPALCFGIWAMVAIMAVCRPGGISSFRSAIYSMLTGVLAGLSAFFRFEMVLIVPIAMITWFLLLVWPLPEKRSWQKLLIVSVCVVIGAVLILFPVVMMAQTDSGELTSSIGRQAASLKVRPETVRFVENPVIEFVGKYFGSQHAVGSGLAVAWAASALLMLVFRSRFLRNNVVLPSRRGTVLMIVSWLILPVPIFLYYIRTGAMSHRYLMMIASIMVGAAGAGLVGMCNPFTGLLNRKGRPAIARMLLPVSCGLLLATIIWHARPPSSPSVRLQEEQAGRYISTIVEDGDTLFADNILTIYFSRMPVTNVDKIQKGATTDIHKGRKTKVEAMISCMRQIRETPFTYCSFTVSCANEQQRECTLYSMSGANYRLVKSFTNDDEAVMVFKLDDK